MFFQLFSCFFEFTASKPFHCNHTLVARDSSSRQLGSFMRQRLSMKSSMLVRVCLLAVFLGLAATGTLANPLGGTVVAGTATFGGTANSLIINQNSSRAVIDWNSFGINLGQSTTFRFLGSAGAGSAVLNRVSSGAGPSIINGLLDSYVGSGNRLGGSVYVINPSGLLIGSQGAINVGSFVGTTLSLGNQSFMAGGSTLNLGAANATLPSSASVVNQGHINALGGDIFLVAQQVQNSGLLSGNNVGLAAGSYVQIKQDGGLAGSDRVSVLAGAPGAPGRTGVDNTSSGVVQAVTTELAAAGGNIYALAIGNEGIVHANTLTSQGGHIYLTAGGGHIANTGTLSANNSVGNGGSVTVNAGHTATSSSSFVNTGSIEAEGGHGVGGRVEISGDHLTLASASVVDVSGLSGGGTALIGGGPHGTDAAVLDASQTSVAAGAVIDADAISSGRGGNVTLWGTDSMQFDGSITARGGGLSGNGGSVEVSGQNTFGFAGMVDTSALHGRIGDLLIDPGSLTIDSNPDPGSLQWSTLVGLNADSTVTTSGTLTLLGTVNLASSHNLSLIAGGDLVDECSINNTLAVSSTALSLSAGGNLTISDAINLAGGSLSLLTAGSSMSGSGLLSINNNLTVGSTSATGSVFAHSGTSGTGNLSVGPGVTVQADNQSYQAGIGDGSSASASANLTQNQPQFWNSAGTASPSTFSYRQDAGMNDINIPAASQFFDGSTPPPVNYSIRSDGGSVTISTGNNFANSVLTLAAPNGSVTVDGRLDLTSLDVSAKSIDLDAAGTTGAASIETAGGQVYKGPVTLSANTVLSDTASGAITFGPTASVSGPAETLDVETAGATSFGAAVAAKSLIVDQTDPSGTISLGGATVTTSAGQTYDGAVTLSANTVLSDTASGAITFGPTASVSGAAETLEVETAGTTSFGAAVAAKSLIVDQTDPSGTISLGAGTVTTSAGQAYDGAVTLSANTVLSDTASGAITFGPTATISGATETLDVETAGATSFGAAVAAKSLIVDQTDPSGTISLGGGTVTTSAGQTYDGPVTLSVNTVLSDTASGAITFGPTATVSGVAETLEVETAGTTSFGAALAAKSLVVDQTDPSGTISLGGGTVTTSASQTYDGPVTLSANTVLSDTASGAITFGPTASVSGAAETLEVETAGATSFGAPVAAKSLIVDQTDPSGTISLGGATVTTSAGQTYDGAVTLSVNTVLSDTASGAITFGPTASVSGPAETLEVETAGATSFGAPVAAKSLLVDQTGPSGTISLGGGTVTTSAGQTYDGAVTLSANTVLSDTASGAITFGPTASVSGPAETLEVETAGATSFGAAVAAKSLIVDQTDPSGTISLGGGTVTTSAGQTYDGPVTLSANTVLSDTASGAITFGPTATVSGATETLDVETAGATSFGAAVAAKSLIVDQTDPSGTISLGGATVTTSAGQTYDGAVTLSANTVLSDTASGAITFGPTATISGATETLEVETAGTTSFGAAVAAKSLLVDQNDPSGTINLGGGTVMTSAGQTYDGAVTLSANTVLSDTASGAVTFGPTATISGPTETLEVETAGTTSFGAAVATKSLIVDQTDPSGTISLGAGTVTTSAGQTYDGAVTLSANTVLSDTASGAITFGPTASVSGAAETLEVETAGATSFGAAVSAKSLLVDQNDPSGTISLGGGTVTTSAGQTYDGVVTLSANTVLSDTASGAITFGPTASVSGATETLDVETAGATSFGAAVAAKSLLVDQTDPSGTISLGGGTVTTSAGQTYDGAVTLSVNTVLSDTASGAITFGPTATISGAAETLEVETAGTTSFGAAVAAKSLIVDQTDPSGTISLGGGTVTTSAGQTYDGPVTLSANTVLSDTASGAITFGPTANVSGTTETLDVETAGATSFGAAVAAKSLIVDQTDPSGRINLGGGTVTTSAGQTYDGAVTLSANTVLSDTASGAITFGPTASVSGAAETLEVETAGTTSFGAAVAAKSLIVDQTDPSGTISLGAGTVTTSAGQTYDGAVTLSVNTVLSDTASGAITFGPTATISGATETLDVETAGATSFGAAVAAKSLIVDQTDPSGTISLGGGTVTTSAGQTYDGAVTLSVNTVLSDTAAGAITFGPTASVSGAAQTLEVETAGATSFGAAVAAKSLIVDQTDPSGTISLGGGTVTTSAGQTYDGAVTLSANTVLSDTASGAITFGPTASVSGAAETLEVETAGATSFGAAVAAKSLIVDQTDPSGTISLDGGTVTTSAGQTYDGAVTLGAKTVLTDTGSGAISFGPAATVNGAESLTVKTDGTTTFSSAIGGLVPLNSLTTGGAGTTTGVGTTMIDGGAVYANTQDYQNAVVLGANTTLAKNNTGTGNTPNAAANVTFGSTLDADSAANNRTLLVDAGTAEFSGKVGAAGTTEATSTALSSLTTEDVNGTTAVPTGTTALNGGYVYASTQDYNDAVTLGRNTTLAEDDLNTAPHYPPTDAATSVTFGSTVEGTTASTVAPAINPSLTVDSKLVVLNGSIGGGATQGVELSLVDFYYSSSGNAGSLQVQVNAPGVIVRTFTPDSQTYSGSFTTPYPLIEEPSGIVTSGTGEIDLEDVIRGIYVQQQELKHVTGKAKARPGLAPELPPGEYLVRSSDPVVPQAP